ncbi:hypothetical protein ACVWYN_000452 [Pedobacter sp. UYP24]
MRIFYACIILEGNQFLYDSIMTVFMSNKHRVLLN